MAKTVAIDYSTSDPRKIASQNRQLVDLRGQDLDAQSRQQAQQAEAQKQQTQDFLGDIQDPLARGEGGYNAEELSQIRMTPEQQQQIVTGAGISAGTGTAAAVQAARRAAAAAGGNPAAMAVYRARAADQQAQQAGDAMTKARVAASDAAAQRATTTGNARLGQQNTALNYYQGLQNQQNQNQQAAYGRQQQTYGTQTGGVNQAGSTGLQASQTPSTFDKVMGGIGGALSFLDAGAVSPGYQPAVVGEGGPERVVQTGSGEASESEGTSIPGTPEYSYQGSGESAQRGPWWQRAAATFKQNLMNPAARPAMPATGAGTPPAATSIGQAAGRVGSLFLEDGGLAEGNVQQDAMDPGGRSFMEEEQVRREPEPPMAGPFAHMSDTLGRKLRGEEQGANGIFTRPTRVNLKPGEAVVPLSYRAGAKTRPSMATNMPPARRSYGGASASLR